MDNGVFPSTGHTNQVSKLMAVSIRLFVTFCHRDYYLNEEREKARLGESNETKRRERTPSSDVISPSQSSMSPIEMEKKRQTESLKPQSLSKEEKEKVRERRCRSGNKIPRIRPELSVSTNKLESSSSSRLKNAQSFEVTRELCFDNEDKSDRHLCGQLGSKLERIEQLETIDNRIEIQTASEKLAISNLASSTDESEVEFKQEESLENDSADLRDLKEVQLLRKLQEFCNFITLSNSCDHCTNCIPQGVKEI